ncbi:MAG TPA: dTDP-glucose 4,6-dehydratase [Methanoregulaceae archaeon]|nr:dTDP-glucose 4,6-dehydratase [Methanoregulaceae archaeon]HOH80345.1 dTDP-glucose 4,6-dehydratase [Methanoregulaceae archaeon]HPW09557.1 dTDP-glucose 4,6-dehydratase [Methanoregulaceae archaeon]HQM56055.1 dTDP-glucose 4,6-dehydratase [Methanoregulaceae archaeon]
MTRMLVTGGAGFIGSNFIRFLLNDRSDTEIVVNLDKLTYAGNLENLKDIAGNPAYRFIRGDICDAELVSRILDEFDIDTVVHFAAESHVDRSISEGLSFVTTNVTGTCSLLEAARKAGISRFIHVSTDEVYGSIRKGSFSETDPLNPSSPYSASKAGSDLLALSYFTTHHVPVIVTRCTNNFGPFQYPEKLIPLFTTNLIEGKKVPVYGSGMNVRDWIYVLDHCRAIACILKKGIPGEIYNIGGGTELTNLEITRKILEQLGKDETSIQFVGDRKGHDFRYSLSSDKLHSLGWQPRFTFDEALEHTIRWYKEQEWWWRKLK